MQEIEFREKKFRKHFEPILSEWLQLLNNFTIDNKGKDALYWYNERATLSSLAGAAWKSQFYALEEFAAQKKKKKKEKAGRIDLWIYRDQAEYIIEAKQKFVSISPQASKTHDFISSALSEAEKDAKASLHKNEGAVGLGVAFIAPYLPPANKHQVEELVTGFVKQLKKIDYDFLAYTFTIDQNHLPTDEEYSYLYPGVALLASRCKQK